MNIDRINRVFSWLKTVGSQRNCTSILFTQNDITGIKNDLIRISEDICRDYPFFSSEVFQMKDRLFYGAGFINPFIWGRIIEILGALQNAFSSQNSDIWDLMHSAIIKSSKQLYLDGHYANAACDAFIEVNDRVKKLYASLRPGDNVPDGTKAMTTVFSDSNPMIAFCERNDDTGHNTQIGYMNMLSGAMSALRNPKAHANITITAEDAMRRLMFASMLMYKIDEAVAYSQIAE